ncbi:MAG: hypothetical protein FOGNACKC_03341 [Anaerolineae bacterium]|nr:hypothetical protein [Anaerolineae bacterium]
MNESHQVRAWYGLTGEIVVENDLWHLVKMGGVPLNHPPIVNLIVRRKLPRQDALRLSYLHEFGHFQTLPLALVHILLLLWGRRYRQRTMGWLKYAIALAVAHQAVWELAAEGYVVGQDSAAYRETYRDVHDSLLLIFWAAVGGLGLGLTWWLLRGN